MSYFVNVCSIVFSGCFKPFDLTSYRVWNFYLGNSRSQEIKSGQGSEFLALLAVYLPHVEVLLSKALNLQLFQLKRYYCGGAGQVFSGVILCVTASVEESTRAE